MSAAEFLSESPKSPLVVASDLSGFDWRRVYWTAAGRAEIHRLRERAFKESCPRHVKAQPPKTFLDAWPTDQTALLRHIRCDARLYLAVSVDLARGFTNDALIYAPTVESKEAALAQHQNFVQLYAVEFSRWLEQGPLFLSSAAPSDDPITNASLRVEELLLLQASKSAEQLLNSVPKEQLTDDLRKRWVPNQGAFHSLIRVICNHWHHVPRNTANAAYGEGYLENCSHFLNYLQEHLRTHFHELPGRQNSHPFANDVTPDLSSASPSSSAHAPAPAPTATFSPPTTVPTTGAAVKTWGPNSNKQTPPPTTTTAQAPAVTAAAIPPRKSAPASSSFSYAGAAKSSAAPPAPIASPNLSQSATSIASHGGASASSSSVTTPSPSTTPPPSPSYLFNDMSADELKTQWLHIFDAHEKESTSLLADLPPTQLPVFCKVDQVCRAMPRLVTLLQYAMRMDNAKSSSSMSEIPVFGSGFGGGASSVEFRLCGVPFNSVLTTLYARRPVRTPLSIPHVNISSHDLVADDGIVASIRALFAKFGLIDEAVITPAVVCKTAVVARGHPEANDLEALIAVTVISARRLRMARYTANSRLFGEPKITGLEGRLQEPVTEADVSAAIDQLLIIPKGRMATAKWRLLLSFYKDLMVFLTADDGKGIPRTPVGRSYLPEIRGGDSRTEQSFAAHGKGHFHQYPQPSHHHQHHHRQQHANKKAH